MHNTNNPKRDQADGTALPYRYIYDRRLTARDIRVLGAISNDGRNRQELAEVTGISEAQVSDAIRNLLRCGYITRGRRLRGAP